MPLTVFRRSSLCWPVAALSCALAVPHPLPAQQGGQPLPVTERSLIPGAPGSLRDAKGETEPLRVIPGDLITVEIPREMLGTREIATYLCEWETEHEECGFLGLGCKTVHEQHRPTQHVNGSLGREIRVTASVGKQSVELTPDHPRRELLAPEPGTLSIRGRVDQTPPPRPDPRADCRRQPQSADPWFTVVVQITRFARF